MSCYITRCRREVEITHLGRDLCDKHWSELADDRVELHAVLDLEQEQSEADWKADYGNARHNPDGSTS